MFLNGQKNGPSQHSQDQIKSSTKDCDPFKIIVTAHTLNLLLISHRQRCGEVYLQYYFSRNIFLGSFSSFVYSAFSLDDFHTLRRSSSGDKCPQMITSQGQKNCPPSPIPDNKFRWMCTGNKRRKKYSRRQQTRHPPPSRQLKQDSQPRTRLAIVIH
jgi:hypothetical protein